jgi:hypothetical protein
MDIIPTLPPTVANPPHPIFRQHSLTPIALTRVLRLEPGLPRLLFRPNPYMIIRVPAIPAQSRQIASKVRLIAETWFAPSGRKIAAYACVVAFGAVGLAGCEVLFLEAVEWATSVGG